MAAQKRLRRGLFLTHPVSLTNAPSRGGVRRRAGAASVATGEMKGWRAMTTEVRLQIALLFYTTVNIGIFTAAVYAATLFPPLLPQAGFWIGAMTAAGLFVAAPLAWWLGARAPALWHDRLVARQSPLARAPTREV